jgi:hypothetical protein
VPTRMIHNPVIRPSAGDILRGSDAELINISKRVRRAERIADRQTAKAKELAERQRQNEASIELRAENQRLRAEIADYVIALGAFSSGNQELGNRLAQIIAPTSGKFVSHFVSDPSRLIEAITDRAELRKRYVYDRNGHRIRADQMDSNRQCHECRRENRRVSHNAESA